MDAFWCEISEVGGREVFWCKGCDAAGFAPVGQTLPAGWGMTSGLMDAWDDAPHYVCPNCCDDKEVE